MAKYYRAKRDRSDRRFLYAKSNNRIGINDKQFEELTIEQVAQLLNDGWIFYYNFHQVLYNRDINERSHTMKIKDMRGMHAVPLENLCKGSCFILQDKYYMVTVWASGASYINCVDLVNADIISLHRGDVVVPINAELVVTSSK